MRIFHISLVNEKHHEEYPVVMRFVMILRIHYNACNAPIKKCIAIRYDVARISIFLFERYYEALTYVM